MPRLATDPANLSLDEVTIGQLHASYRAGAATVVEVVSAYLARIAAWDSRTNAVLAINPDALRIAAELDAQSLDGRPVEGLYGVPILLKDNIDTHDRMPTTAGSLALKDWFPRQDSAVAANLRAAGAVILGKANLSEWANYRGQRSTSGWSAVGGQTRNPYDLTRSPCGSSSGSGAAVAANLCALAIGTETNGSIVCPSSVNGVVGIKPTVGLVSRAGIVPISHTQDTAGPMARTVYDAALCLNALAGGDDDMRDLTAVNAQEHALPDYSPDRDVTTLKGVRIGLWCKPLGKHAVVDALFRRAVADLRSLGAEMADVEGAFDSPEIGAMTQAVMRYEFKDGLNRYLASLPSGMPARTLSELIAFNERTEGELGYFGQELFIAANATEGLETDEYRHALTGQLRATRQEGIDREMDALDLDAIVAPTCSPAWTIDPINGDHFSLGSSSPAAISGYPAITLPMGHAWGLPVGISLFGRAWSERELIQIAYAYEQSGERRYTPAVE